ncbi:MAG: hypothetical protein U0790_29545 [Isosphaeraceae bacterium]
MNPDQMLDYVLGRLDDLDREGLERMLQGNPAAEHRARHLGQCVSLLLDDGCHTLTPPPGLARRTLTLVAEARSRPRSILDYVPTRVPFRWADFAVAASIFLAGFLTLVPAIQHSRGRMNQAGCVFNLQQIGHSLAQYATMHPFYPYPPGNQPDAPAGTFAAVLHDAGLLRDLSVLHCPCNGPCSGHVRELPACEQLVELRRSEPDRFAKLLRWDYAYNVGYRHPSGKPGPVESRLPMAIPVVADAPAHVNYTQILDGNSPNHGRRGQNVLYSDGSVHWLRTRRVSPHDADLFLNKLREVGPGMDELDAALLPSYTPFNGPGGH